jgi:hypothetical protein
MYGNRCIYFPEMYCHLMQQWFPLVRRCLFASSHSSLLSCTLYRLVNYYWRFEEEECLRLQGQIAKQTWIFLSTTVRTTYVALDTSCLSVVVPSSDWLSVSFCQSVVSVCAFGCGLSTNEHICHIWVEFTDRFSLKTVKSNLAVLPAN